MATLEEWIGLYYTLSVHRRLEISASQAEPPGPKPRVKAGKRETMTILLEAEKPLFNSLKRWRGQVAKDLQQPPYMVFSDKTLINIAHYSPSTLDELLEIHGVGKDKLEKHGDTILELVTESLTTE